jgi:TatA/E family protein of Tat protein translocase
MNFLGMGPMELMLILVLALIIFGPGKLPEIAGQVGKVVRDFRRTTSELSSEFSRTLSLEVEERRSAEAPAAAPEAYAAPAPPVPETLYPSTDTAVAHVEPAEIPPAPVQQVAPPVAAVSTPGKRTYDADLAPPY